MTVLPFISAHVTPDLRRAAEYHERHPLTDREVVAVLQRESEALIGRWTALGAWLRQLDAGARPVLSRKTVNNPSQARRDQLSATMKQVWATKRATSREFGQRAAWRTPAQKAYISAQQRAAWARRRAIAKEA
jgi:hypothetical protein